MFVLDELADELLEQGKDVLKLTIGVPELPTPKPVLDRIVGALTDPDHVRRVILKDFRNCARRLSTITTPNTRRTPRSTTLSSTLALHQYSGTSFNLSRDRDVRFFCRVPTMRSMYTAQRWRTQPSNSTISTWIPCVSTWIRSVGIFHQNERLW